MELTNPKGILADTFWYNVVATVCIDSAAKINNQDVNLTFLLKYSLTREAVTATIMASVISVSWLYIT